MLNLTINQLNRFAGKDVELKGWVHNTRSVGKIWFLIFRDGTGFLQCVVVKNEVSDEIFNLEQILGQEDSVIIKGNVRPEPRSPGGFELAIKDITVINHVEKDFPISPKDHGTDFLMSNRHLWLRSKRQKCDHEDTPSDFQSN